MEAVWEAQLTTPVYPNHVITAITDKASKVRNFIPDLNAY